MNKNAKEKQLLEEAYTSIYLEAKEAPKGKHYDSAGRLRSGDADADGRGGPKYRSDPTYKNPNEDAEGWQKGTSKAPKGKSFDMSRGGAPSNVDAARDGSGGRYRRTRPPSAPSKKTHGEMEEEDNEKDLSKMYKFGNIQFMHLGKDRNGAEAFRVFKDGSYVLYATMFGPRKTVTLYADPEADGQQTAGPEEGKALKEFDKTQVPGGIKQVAAKLGASEDAEEDNEGMSNLDALISSAEDGELDIKQGGGTSAAEFGAEEKTEFG